MSGFIIQGPKSDYRDSLGLKNRLYPKFAIEMGRTGTYSESSRARTWLLGIVSVAELEQVLGVVAPVQL